MSDLVRKVDLKCSVDFMAVSSYGNGTTSTGAVKIMKDLSEDIAGRHVVIVEDILAYIKNGRSWEGIPNGIYVEKSFC